VILVINLAYSGLWYGGDGNMLSDLQDNERSRDILIENRFHRQLIGQKGRWEAQSKT